MMLEGFIEGEIELYGTIDNSLLQSQPTPPVVGYELCLSTSTEYIIEDGKDELNKSVTEDLSPVNI